MRAAVKGPPLDSPVLSRLTVGWLEGALAMTEWLCLEAASSQVRGAVGQPGTTRGSSRKEDTRV